MAMAKAMGRKFSFAQAARIGMPMLGRPRYAEYDESQHKADVEALLSAGKTLKEISSEKKLRLVTLKKAFKNFTGKTGPKLSTFVEKIVTGKNEDAKQKLELAAEKIWTIMRVEELKSELAQMQAKVNGK